MQNGKILTGTPDAVPVVKNLTGTARSFESITAGSYTKFSLQTPITAKGVIHLSETGFSFGMYVKQTFSIQPVSMDS